MCGTSPLLRVERVTDRAVPPFPARRPDTLLLTITYSPTYPDELPEIGLETLEGELDEEEEEELVMGMIGAVRLASLPCSRSLRAALDVGGLGKPRVLLGVYWSRRPAGVIRGGTECEIGSGAHRFNLLWLRTARLFSNKLPALKPTSADENTTL